MPDNPIALPVSPRIEPITEREYTDQVREFFSLVEGPGGRAGGSKLNLVQTLAKHPDLAVPYFDFGCYILNRSSLSARTRELLTLRASWLFRSAYEWDLHVIRAKNIGISQHELDALEVGSSAPIWSTQDRHLLAAVEQLHDQTAIHDATWRGLSEFLDSKQLLDLLFTVGSYAMLAMVLNGVGVKLENPG